MPPSRRGLLLVLASFSTSVLFFSLVRPPAQLLPAFLAAPGLDDDWFEWDDDGKCMLLSPLEELSPSEREAALSMAATSSSTPSAAMLAFDPSSASAAIPHPILGLLAQGTQAWTSLLSSQSRTLAEAVHAYSSRNHGRLPPKGFDAWWALATTNQVLLPDEYDSISHALEPLWALSPEEVGRRCSEAEDVPETFTLIVKGGKVVLQWNDEYSRNTWWSARERADQQMNLMVPFLDKLGEMRLTFSIHDRPSVLLPYERKAELLGIAGGPRGAHTDQVVEPDLHDSDWRGTCPPNSPARTGGISDPTHESSSVNFVVDHEAMMDPCSHPSLLLSHSHYLTPQSMSSSPRPHSRLLPILSLATTVAHSDLPAAPMGIISGGLTREDTGREPPGGWAGKASKLYWRGAMSSEPSLKASQTMWTHSHRSRLHALATSNSTSRHQVLLPMVDPATGTPGLADPATSSFSEKMLRERWLDARLEGTWECEHDAKDCLSHKEKFSHLRKDSPERINDFKYILDLDGDDFSKRFPKLMAAQNMVIKAGIFPEWNMAGLPEWFAYVPANLDFSDLYSILGFFNGHPASHKGSHDRVARRIASNGQCWVERTWRQEDMEVYMMRLYLELQRLLSPDRDSGKMDFKFANRAPAAPPHAAAHPPPPAAARPLPH